MLEDEKKTLIFIPDFQESVKPEVKNAGIGTGLPIQYSKMGSLIPYNLKVSMSV